MEPISLIVSAVALGASAALKETAAGAVKDAYEGLKRVLGDLYQSRRSVSETVEFLERKPEDKNRRAALEAEIAEVSKTVEPKVVAASRAVIEAVEKHHPEAAKAIGMDIGLLKAEVLNVKNVAAPGVGTGVRIAEAQISGAANFENIGGAPPPKN